MNQNDSAQEAQGNTVASNRVVFSARDWLIVGLALAQAILWFSIFGSEALLSNGPFMPQLGFTVFTVVQFCIVLIVLGKKACWNKITITGIIVVGLLALIPSLFADQWLIFANAIILFIVSTVEIFLLAGLFERAWDQLHTWTGSFVLFCRSLFRDATKLLHLSSPSPAQGKEHLRSIGFGVLLACTILIIVLPLLASADAVFSGLFTGIASWLTKLNPWDSIWNIVRVLILAPMLFSLLYGLSHRLIQEHASTTNSTGEQNINGSDNRKVWPIERQPLHTATAVTTLIVLNAVYLVFVCIQITFLFGGLEAASMHGGYAQYARTGFFQLVAVAAVNLTVALYLTHRTSPRQTNSTSAAPARNIPPAVRWLIVVLIIFTAVILTSACWRMCLYVSVYGLSLLRALTFLGMAFIGICLIAALCRVFRASFNFFRVFVMSGLALWIAFNFINVDRLIAEVNVTCYLDGRLERLDTRYLATLSPDVIPALEHYAAEKPAEAAERGVVQDIQHLNRWKIDLSEPSGEITSSECDLLPWHKWCLSQVRYR